MAEETKNTPSSTVVVALDQRLEHQPADAGPGEHRLGQHRAADDLPGLEAGQRHDRQDGVARDVPARMTLPREPLGAGGPDEIRARTSSIEARIMRA